MAEYVSGRPRTETKAAEALAISGDRAGGALLRVVCMGRGGAAELCFNFLAHAFWPFVKGRLPNPPLLHTHPPSLPSHSTPPDRQ